MFPTFSGSSRRPRQVNLSGKNINPLVSSGIAKGQPAALATAQRERTQRQRERERQNAAKSIQRSWRGHNARKTLRDELRKEWDSHENISLADDTRLKDSKINGYESESEMHMQIQRLLQFSTLQNTGDIQRILRWYERHQKTYRAIDSVQSTYPWNITYSRLQKTILYMLASDNQIAQIMFEFSIFDVLAFTAQQTPRHTSENTVSYYRVLGLVTTSIIPEKSSKTILRSLLQAVFIPMKVIDTHTIHVYGSFALNYLTVPKLYHKLKIIDGLGYIAGNINYRTLGCALLEKLQEFRTKPNPELYDANNRMWLLVSFIYINRYAFNFTNFELLSSSSDFISVVSILLSSIAIYYKFDISGTLLHQHRSSLSRNSKREDDQFVQDQMLSLVNEKSVRNLLSEQDFMSESCSISPTRPKMRVAGDFATYALTLLQIFPRYGDEIKMWLYLGSTFVKDSNYSNENTSSLKYFWEAFRNTQIFTDILLDSKITSHYLRELFNEPHEISMVDDNSRFNINADLKDGWSLIIIFLELYSFVLRVMDDDEFFATSVADSVVDKHIPSTKAKALPLKDVKDLITFLKHLGFTMYFNGPDILGASEKSESNTALSGLFARSQAHISFASLKDEDRQRINHSISSLGISMDYLKNLVTGLLRVLYERDSRRKFTPKDHWLMSSRLDMSGFIPAVVFEEEKRHQVQDTIDEEYEELNYFQNEDTHLIGAGRTQRTQGTERIKRQQDRATRKRDMELVAPRLEILENMPFLISFPIRVQIFREFVHQDQLKRRNGMVDPDMWRWSLMGHPAHRDRVEKHQAKIRRKFEFDDAYDQFYQLGDSLKEPIYITFVDQFDNIEAGIDGGGVTKEFLTSVTGQAFKPNKGLDMFVANENHLLYPNPVAISEYKEHLRQAGITDQSTDFKPLIKEILQKYEFLGRIIGKCLYEGILVDLKFASFFLLKWALTGGIGSAPRESNYRANMNDLRDLDEALYQGLLQLKNYFGDVEDFALNFTVTDTIKIDYETPKTRNITSELRANGANISVTNENRLLYISDISRYRLQIQPYLQSSAFLKGLSSIIQPSWLAMFNQGELQTLISGTSKSIDLTDLRQHTEYGGLYVVGDDRQEHPSVVLFWRVMRGLSDEEQRAVLKFITSTPRAPLLGFGSLYPRFTIRDAGSDEDRLPSTSTCVNLLKLPKYSNEAVLKEKLLYAAFSGAGFDLS